MIYIQIHLPSYVQDYDQLKAKGVEVVACVSVNDVFVMAAWGESQNASGKIHMLADASAEFTKVNNHVSKEWPWYQGGWILEDLE